MLAALPKVRLIVTTRAEPGNAGAMSTPEATAAVCDRLARRRGGANAPPGHRRRAAVRGVWPRSMWGAGKAALILNLPGSPSGAIESLEAVARLSCRTPIESSEGRNTEA